MKSSITIFILVLLLSWSCSTPKRMALPEAYLEEAEVVGMPGVRDWAHKRSELFQKVLVEGLRQTLENDPDLFTNKNSTIDVLAVSGGGSNGAFGVGLLSGWAESGTRPTFSLVTGISTGALIAPFAFLGPDYEDPIIRMYTTVNTKDIIKNKSFFSILGGSDSMADSSPLANIIAGLIDEEFLAAVAKAYSEGRRLLIGTTNLDARKLVIWNMGKIASIGTPEALKLFRDIMLASSSIPVAFPPVFVEVEAGGNIYDEMHVDGGVVTEVFFYGFTVDIDEALDTIGVTEKPKLRVFIIRNNQIEPRYEPVNRNILSIAEKSLSNLTTSQGIGDLFRIYLITQKDDIDFNLAFIPESFIPDPKEPFDPVEMKRLYNLGYEMAKNGYPWQKYPPFYNQ